MINKTRKRIWPVSLAAVIGVVAMLAVLATVALPAGTARAQPTDPAKPTMVGGLTANPMETSVTLTWTAATMGAFSISGHEVEYQAAGASSWMSSADELTATATNHDVTGLTASTSYNFRVRAVAGSQGQFEGPWATVSAMTTDPGSGTGSTGMNGTSGASIVSSSTSASATVQLKLTIPDLTAADADKLKSGGSSVVLYLEDQFKVPETIDRDTVYFTASGSASMDESTSNGRRVYATDPVEIDTDDHFTADKKDWDIQVLIPDMNTTDDDDYSGFDGPKAEQTLILTFTKSSGIKNDSEAGDHSVGYSILGPNDAVGDPQVKDAGIAGAPLATVAKIALSDVDNDRGYELTVTGSGFNDGTSATVHVLGYAVERWWKTLDCDKMKVAMGYLATDMSTAAQAFCGQFPGYGTPVMSDDSQAAVKRAALGDREDKRISADQAKTNEAQVCGLIIQRGHRAGIATVGSDDTVAVVLEVTVPIFVPGKNNYICMADGEGRQSDTDVEDFELLDSISVVPGSANAGDTVNVFARDFPNNGESLTELIIHGHVVYPESLVHDDFPGNFVDPTTKDSIRSDGSATVTFKLPGSLSGVPLEGTIRIDARWGGAAPFDTDKGVTEDDTITVTGSALRVSQGEVRANESLTIQGDGFGNGSKIMEENITIDGVALLVDNDSLTNDMVEVSSAGQFVATVYVWSDSDDNPTLLAGTHTIRVEDDQGFFGTTTVVIKEPSMSITPDVLGPRDYLIITGTDWPVDNTDSDATVEGVKIEVGNERPRTYTAVPDATGRFTVEHRVKRDVGIPSTQQVKASYGDKGAIVKITSFEVPEAIIEVTPGVGQPGDTVSLSATGMPVYTELAEIEIGGANALGGRTFRTDRDGAVTADDLLIPGLDPGTYSVIMKVGERGENQVIAIGSLDVLAEGVSGTIAELPAALDNLGTNLVRVFQFDGVTKTWDFFDPRSDFADLNTLTGMVDGQPYWILVSEGAEDVVLNNKPRTLTCVGGDCWNQLVW